MVTSSKSLLELLLLLLSSSPSPCRSKEKRRSITRDPGTPFAVQARASSQRDVWPCGRLEPGFAPMVLLWNHVCPWPCRDLQSQEQGFGGVCSADSIAVHSSVSFGLK